MPTTIIEDAAFDIFAVGDRTDSSGVDEFDLSSSEARLISSLFYPGYVGDDDSFVVKHSSGMGITIGSGNAKKDMYVIEGKTVGQGNYVVRLADSQVSLTVPAADASSRTDEVYLVVFDSSFDTGSVTLPRIGYRRGDAGAGNPGPESAWEAYELICRISVAGGASSVSGGISDQRNKAALVDSLNHRATPPGTVDMFAGTTAPDGWLLCQGQAVSRTTYADLFAAIGTTWGSGNGSTTFNIPDSRGRFPVGVGTGFALASSGGASTVALTTSHMPSHSHGSGTLSAGSTNLGSHAHPYHTRGPQAATSHGHPTTNRISRGSGGGNDNLTVTNETGAIASTNLGSHNHSVSGSTAAVGSGSAHENKPPYRTYNFKIKF